MKRIRLSASPALAGWVACSTMGAGRGGAEVVKPELGTTFDSLTEAYDFYNLPVRAVTPDLDGGCKVGNHREEVAPESSMAALLRGCEDGGGAAMDGQNAPGWIKSDGGIYCVHYLKEYAGAAFATPITNVSAKFLRKSLTYQVCTLKNNRGELSKFMIGLKS